jgi:hypothetical protein
MICVDKRASQIDFMMRDSRAYQSQFTNIRLIILISHIISDIGTSITLCCTSVQIIYNS